MFTSYIYLYTGSGKTYTIEGTKESLGIIPRAAEQIFYRILTTVHIKKITLNDQTFCFHSVVVIKESFLHLSLKRRKYNYYTKHSKPQILFPQKTD